MSVDRYFAARRRPIEPGDRNGGWCHDQIDPQEHRDSCEEVADVHYISRPPNYGVNQGMFLPALLDFGPYRLTCF